MKPTLIWLDDGASIENIEEKIFEDLQKNLGHMWNDNQSWSELIFHTIFLTDDMDGPSVMVSGIDDDPSSLHASYEDTTVLMSLKDLEKDYGL